MCSVGKDRRLSFHRFMLLLSREVAHMPTKCVQVDVPKEYLQIDAWLEFCRPSCAGPYWAA